MAKIILNNKEFNINESVLAPAKTELKAHLSTIMNGEGAIVNFDGTAYNIDSSKLTTATNSFVSHLGTIAGSGSKVVVNGVEYGVDAAKISGSISELETIFGNLNNPAEPEVITYYTQEDINNSGGLLLGIGATNPLYVVAAVSADYSTITITKNGVDSDGLMMNFPQGYVANLGVPFTTVVIENGVVNVGEYAFYYCTSLTSVMIPASVTNISTCAFYNCTALTSVEIPSGVETIGDNAFDHCTSLESIIFVEDSQLKTIALEAFSECSNLASVEIPASVMHIGNCSFMNCTSLKSITFAEGSQLKTIDSGAFSECPYASITIPASVTSISGTAFNDCDSLESIVFEGTVAQWNDAFTSWQYVNGNYTIYCTDGTIAKDGTVTYYPSESEERLEGDGAEFYTLAPTALSFRSTAPLNELQEIQINGVTVDPANYTLEEGSTIVTFPIEYLKTLNVGSYEVAVASDSKTVKGDFTVKAPELNEHGFYYNQPYVGYVSAVNCEIAFFVRDDGTFDSIAIGANTESGTYEISENTIIAVSPLFGQLNCVISSDGTEIFCNELQTAFKLGNSMAIAADEDYIYIYKEDLGGYEVTAIDKTKSEYGAIKTGINGADTVGLARQAFFNCTFIKSVGLVGSGANLEIPASVTTLGELAFRNCTSLTSIEIPASVTSICAGVFDDCTNLSKFIFAGTIAQWEAIPKSEVGVTWHINVPATYVQCSDGQVAL